jgi:hypothetical protein
LINFTLKVNPGKNSSIRSQLNSLNKKKKKKANTFGKAKDAAKNRVSFRLGSKSPKRLRFNTSDMKSKAKIK